MIIRAFLTTSSGTLVSRILGFLRDMATASVLGANIYTDIFFVAFKLPNLFRRVFAEGAFMQAFLPSFAASRYKGRFSVEVFTRLMLWILGLSVLVVLFPRAVALALAYGFPPELREMAAPFIALHIWYLDLIFVVTFLAALLQYKNHFATTAFSTGLLNLAMIAALLFAAGMEKLEIVWWLSYGVIAGGLLQVAVHLLAAERKGVCKVLVAGAKKPRETGGDVKRFTRSFLPAVLGSSTAHLSAFLDTFLASFLAAGSISYLYYANRIFQLPLALFAIAVSTALFPSISRAIKNMDEAKALALLEKSFRLLLFLLAAACVGGAMLADEILWLLFERGEFVREDTLASGAVLVMYMAGLLPFGLAKIFSLWLYAHHRQGEAAKLSAVALGFNVVFSLALIGPMGAPGLALASSLAGIVLFALNIRAFGWTRFAPMLRGKWLGALALLLLAEVLVLWAFKEAVAGMAFG